jgi:ABC-type transport system involved in multi-copper enzyme maturation permease subunit
MAEIQNTARGWLRRSLGWSNSRQAWEERIGLAAVLLIATLLSLFYGRMPLVTWVFAWLFLGGLTAVLLRRGWLRLLGPMLFYELMRIARRPRYFWMRGLYALLLAGTLGWMYMMWERGHAYESLHAREVSAFAETFFYTFMFIQLITTAILAPAYTAGAIADEKERKTLEFLLATDLRNREIVLSKFASRVANLLLLVMAGLPILGLIQFLGGVDPNLVLAGFLITGLTIVSLASLSLLNSVMSKKSRDAIALTYFGGVAYLCLSGLSWLSVDPSLGIADFPSRGDWTSPITVADVVHGFNAGNFISLLSELQRTYSTAGNISSALPGLVRGYAIFHIAVCLACIGWSIVRVRAIAMRQAQGATTKAFKRRWFVKPPIGAHPMVWKEVFAERGLRLTLLTRILLVVLVGASLVPAGLILFHPGQNQSGADLADAMTTWVRVVGTMVACLLLLAVAGRAASSLSAERDRQTLDALLASPLSGDDIVFGKWLGNITSIRWGWLWLVLIYVLGLITGGLHPLAIGLLVIAWFVYAGTISFIGIWFSLVCRSTLRATVASLLATTAAGIGHWLLWLCCMPLFYGGGASGMNLEPILKLQAGMTPPVVMGYFFCFGWSEFGTGRNMYGPHPEELLGYGLAGLVCWLIAAVVMSLITRERFRTITGRVDRRRPDYPKSRGPRSLSDF